MLISGCDAHRPMFSMVCEPPALSTDVRGLFILEISAELVLLWVQNALMYPGTHFQPHHSSPAHLLGKLCLHHRRGNPHW